MGQSFLADGNNDEARKFFQNILDINSRNLHGIYGIAKCLFINNEISNASKEIKKCIGLSSNEKDKYLYLIFLIACTPPNHMDYQLINLLVPNAKELSRLKELAKDFKKNPTHISFSPYSNNFWDKMSAGLSPVNKQAGKELIPYTEIDKKING